MRRIILEIDQDGEVNVEAQGYVGKSCMKDTEWLEKLLGKVTKRTFKKEYHEYEVVKIGR